MDKVQYNLFCEVLRRMDKEGVLDHVVLIGSWCLLAYKDFFKNVQYRPGIRTRDIDILVPVPPGFERKVDMEELLKDLDFVVSLKGRDGYMQLVHRDLMLEFIVPERGRGSEKPFVLSDLGVNAQPLRFMDFLLGNIIRLKLNNTKVSVPHPANFALLKVIVSVKRKKPVKRENDMRQALEIMRALMDSGYNKVFKDVFLSCPAKWQKTIRDELLNVGEDEIVAFIST